MAPFYVRQVNCTTLRKSVRSRLTKPELRFQQLDPRRALQVLHWPIRVIRVATDPVVDSIFLIIGYLILPSIARMLEGCFTVAFWALSKVVPGDALQKSARFIDNAVSILLLLFPCPA